MHCRRHKALSRRPTQISSVAWSESVTEKCHMKPCRGIRSCRSPYRSGAVLFPTTLNCFLYSQATLKANTARQDPVLKRRKGAKDMWNNSYSCCTALSVVSFEFAMTGGWPLIKTRMHRVRIHPLLDQVEILRLQKDAQVRWLRCFPVGLKPCTKAPTIWSTRTCDKINSSIKALRMSDM